MKLNAQDLRKIADELDKLKATDVYVTEFKVGTLEISVQRRLNNGTEYIVTEINSGVL